ncbi:polygalacturonase inhibitor-like [Olea europaea subsp. europaea]|uniref:Polygalacturonase inhibitor-like n=1 Tax=Olea europaea subsp. europaea TaxID=158383 RepID=A0A8S0PUF6_OLEEU|nr:polygalacturonase inhibitor-like [Olea europaea subsp. europaea]
MAFQLLCIISLLIFLSLPFSSLSATEKCHPHDKEVLLKIKDSFNNPYHLASWDPKTDCCQWYVVECDRETNRINDFHLFAANVSGQIPPEIGDLPYLESLTFHKITNLTGNIPISILKLTKLKSLTISWTNISGPIPSFLSQFKNLTFLDLSFNNFSGSIPSSLSELRNLGGIRLDRNKLTGSIPESFGNLTPSLQYLYLSHNQLTGTIPRSWGDLNFTLIELYRNRLQGDVSFMFGKNKTIQILDLNRNMLQFDISNVVFPDSLTFLDLNHNRVTGSLPQGLTQLSLQGFNVSYNRLCGPIPRVNVSGQIPEEIGDLPYLESLTFHKITNLTGNIPASIVKLTKLKSLTLSWTNISGPVPSFLDQKKLSGSIPESFGNLTPNLQYLYLSHNQLSGTIPKSWGDLNFTWIELHRNKLEGDISFMLGKNKTIQILDVNRNILQFDISNVEFPNSLRFLDLNHNRIRGSLPGDLIQLGLDGFNVSFNRLCGPIPQGGTLQNFEYTE